MMMRNVLLTGFAATAVGAAASDQKKLVSIFDIKL
jgi:hypothetical protein